MEAVEAAAGAADELVVGHAVPPGSGLISFICVYFSCFRYKGVPVSCVKRRY
jgi:hypothetical protein